MVVGKVEETRDEQQTVISVRRSQILEGGHQRQCHEITNCDITKSLGTQACGTMC